MKKAFAILGYIRKRLALHRLLQLLSVILFIFTSSQSSAATLTKSQSDLEKRVESVRSNLLSSTASHTESSVVEKNPKQLAQWYNWPNWPNWSNWRNW